MQWLSCIRRDQGSVLGVAIERHAVYMPFLQADINTAWLVLRDFSRWPLFFFVLQFSPADISRRLARSTIIYCFLIPPSTRARILLLALPPRPPPVLHPAITNSQPHVLPFLSPFLPPRPLSSKKNAAFQHERVHLCNKDQEGQEGRANRIRGNGRPGLVRPPGQQRQAQG